MTTQPGRRANGNGRRLATWIAGWLGPLSTLLVAVNRAAYAALAVAGCGLFLAGLLSRRRAALTIGAAAMLAATAIAAAAGAATAAVVAATAGVVVAWDAGGLAASLGRLGHGVADSRLTLVRVGATGSVGATAAGTAYVVRRLAASGPTPPFVAVAFLLVAGGVVAVTVGLDGLLVDAD